MHLIYVYTQRKLFRQHICYILFYKSILEAPIHIVLISNGPLNYNNKLFKCLTTCFQTYRL